MDLRQGADEPVQPFVIAQPADEEEERRSGGAEERRGECSGKLGAQARQIGFGRLDPEARQRNAIGDQMQLGLMLAEEGAAAHGRAADDDGVDPAQHAAEQRP